MKTLLSRSLLIILGLTSICGTTSHSFAMEKNSEEKVEEKEIEEKKDNLNVEGIDKITEKTKTTINKLLLTIEKLLKSYDKKFLEALKHSRSENSLKKLQTIVGGAQNYIELANAGVDMFADKNQGEVLKKDNEKITWGENAKNKLVKGAEITKKVNTFSEAIEKNKAVADNSNLSWSGIKKGMGWVLDRLHKITTGHFYYHGPFVYEVTSDNSQLPLCGIYYTNQNVDEGHIISQREGYLAILVDKKNKEYAQFAFNTIGAGQDLNLNFHFHVLDFLRHDALKALIDNQLSQKDLEKIIYFLEGLGTFQHKQEEKYKNERQSYRLNDLAFSQRFKVLFDTLHHLVTNISKWSTLSSGASPILIQNIKFIKNLNQDESNKELLKKIKELENSIDKDTMKEKLESNNEEMNVKKSDEIEEEESGEKIKEKKSEESCDFILKTITIDDIKKDVQEAGDYYKQQRKLRDEKKVKKEDINKNLLNNNNNQQVFENKIEDKVIEKKGKGSLKNEGKQNENIANKENESKEEDIKKIEESKKDKVKK
jgi:hypothetical protein